MDKEEIVKGIALKLALPDKVVASPSDWFVSNHQEALHDALLSERLILVADLTKSINDAYNHWLSRYNAKFIKVKGKK